MGRQMAISVQGDSLCGKSERVRQSQGSELEQEGGLQEGKTVARASGVGQ